LQTLAESGLVAREDGHFLSLATPIDVDQWRDSGIAETPAAKLDIREDALCSF